MNILASIFLLIGSIFIFLASLGILRMPDLYLRAQAATKAGTLGVGCILIGVAIYFNDVGTWTRAVLTVLFLFLTAPVAAHLVTRVAHQIGVPVSENTKRDDLDREEHKSA